MMPSTRWGAEPPLEEEPLEELPPLEEEPPEELLDEEPLEEELAPELAPLLEPEPLPLEEPPEELLDVQLVLPELEPLEPLEPLDPLEPPELEPQLSGGELSLLQPYRKLPPMAMLASRLSAGNRIRLPANLRRRAIEAIGMQFPMTVGVENQGPRR